MPENIAILGRQPELGLAELEALYGASAVSPVGDQACLINTAVDFKRLGGTVKLARVIGRSTANSWTADLAGILKNYVERNISDGKIQLGFSAYGIDISSSGLSRVGLSLKKQLKAQGRSLRLVPNRSPQLNAAQVLYNKMTSERGIELVLVKDGEQIIIARTEAVQDIDAYTRRDRNKPVRDMQVGMLPPKLAQILINLTGLKTGRLLDPFCGTGTLLMEASLMGINIYGSDLSSKMTQATAQNLHWLDNPQALQATIEKADARRWRWQPPIDAVATETYLGPPLSTFPARAELEKIIAEVDKLHRDFLNNVAAQLDGGTPIILAVPAWQRPNGRLEHLPMVDDLESMGYNRIRFKHQKDRLVYRRSDQIVAREILVLTRKQDVQD